MSREIREADLRALLRVASIEPGEPYGRGLPDSMLLRAFQLIGCDLVAFSDFDPRTWESYSDQGYPPFDAHMGEDAASAFPRHYWDSCCSYPSTTGDELTVTKISDFHTLPKFHNTGMYAEYLSLCKVEREIMLCLPGLGTRTRRLLFFRGAGSDFSERDRLLLSLLRPHLTEAYRSLERSRRGAAKLTPRQHHVMRLVAAGYTNVEIANGLFVSALTVRKHLENVYERLGVTTRTAAVALVFPDGVDDHVMEPPTIT